MNVLGIIVAILIFGLLIFIHEGGHFLCARLFRVTINEFSIGMGPKLISKKSKKSGTEYSLRALPIGGYVSMVGEDEESTDENAFTNKPVWQRIIITVAGATVNIVAGILVMCLLVIFTSGLLPSNTVAGFITDDASSQKSGLAVGDTIVEIDGTPIHIGNEIVYEIMRKGIEPVDIVVMRDGNRIVLEDVVFSRETEEGITYGTMDFSIYGEAKNFGTVVKHSFFRSVSTIKMIWESLFDLVTGRYGLEAVSGPVGVTTALGDAMSAGFGNFVYLSVVISMNLGVMNLLPLPALDGGRLVFQIIEAIRRKPLSREIEGKIHFAGIIILMIIMVLITFKDIFTLFS